MIKSLFTFIYFLVIVNCFSQEVEKTSKSYSMIPLIANPEKYDGKWIGITGFLKYEKEGDILIFFSRDDLIYTNYKNCFVLYLDKNKLAGIDLSHYDGHCVSIIGHFSNIKHYYYGGAVEGVTYIESRDDINIEIKAMEIEERKKKN
jgi:hypothetical protein